MSDPRLGGEESVPDKALQELLAAFAQGEPVPADEIDFDDPSIDRMLGLGPAPGPAGSAGGPDLDPVTERVPEVAILSTAKKLELPTWEEGFDQLFYVRLEDRRFAVEEWRDEV